MLAVEFGQHTLKEDGSSSQTLKIHLENKVAYPTVSPKPFSFSTRMSKTSSPVLGSHFTRLQFRRPMMNFCFRGDPSVSVWKMGI